MAISILFLSGCELEPQGGLGFSSLHYVMNKEEWPKLQSSGRTVKTGRTRVDLSSPKEVLFIHNAWHLPAAEKDIRLEDMSEHVLKDELELSTEWPPAVYPGYVAVVKRKDGARVLVAELGGFFFLQLPDGLGVVKRAKR